MKVYSIYEIKNLINGKIYIGYTDKTPEKRFKHHLVEVMNGSDTKWHRALRKYGEESFQITCLYQTFDRDDIFEKERYFIKTFDTINSGYNTHEGGSGGNTGAYHKVGRSGARNHRYGIKMTQEELARRSKTYSENWKLKSESEKKVRGEKVRAKLKGRPFTPEHKENVRKAAQNRDPRGPVTEYTLTDSDNNEYKILGKIKLVEFCNDRNIDIWTVERILLQSKTPKRGSCLGWSAVRLKPS